MWEVRIPEIEDRSLQSIFRDAAREFIRAFALDGLEFVDRRDIHVYGPFTSVALRVAQLDPELLAGGKDQAAQLKTYRADPGEMVSYIMVADFRAVKDRVMRMKPRTEMSNGTNL